jgi:hypothetical protein
MIQGITHAIYEQPNGALENQSLSEVLVADVVFGSPSNNCAGSGICRVTAPIAQEMGQGGHWGCHRAIALVRTTPGVLAFHFVLQSMCREAIEQHFSGGYFLVESPFVFRPDYWVPEQGIQVQPGAYPVARSQDYLTVSFRLNCLIRE